MVRGREASLENAKVAYVEVYINIDTSRAQIEFQKECYRGRRRNHKAGAYNRVAEAIA
jgi:hypothetical protein